MSLFIATGSNLGNKLEHLNHAKDILSTHFTLLGASRVYESEAIIYLEQDNFYNQVLEFKSPGQGPEEVMKTLLKIENDMGVRNIFKGPRIIDLDLLFFDHLTVDSDLVKIPHPELFKRSFVVLPLSELPGFDNLKQYYQFSNSFDNNAFPINN
jgi:2-amino-4-hydroxy-6-hydroxymethyldihydropteridine diphosphokinase